MRPRQPDLEEIWRVPAPRGATGTQAHPRDFLIHTIAQDLNWRWHAIGSALDDPDVTMSAPLDAWWKFGARPHDLLDVPEVPYER
jgi:hypothetical protein